MVDLSTPTFVDEYNPAGTPSSVFMGSVGDLITATVQASVHWESIGVILTVARTFATPTLTRNDNVSWLACGFRVGDTITNANDQTNIRNGNYTITALTDLTMTISSALT